MQNFPTIYKPQTDAKGIAFGNPHECQNATENDATCDPAIQAIKDDRIFDLNEGYFIAAEEAPPPVSAEPEELSTNIRTSSNTGGVTTTILASQTCYTGFVEPPTEWAGQHGTLPWEVPQNSAIEQADKKRD